MQLSEAPVVERYVPKPKKGQRRETREKGEKGDAAEGAHKATVNLEVMEWNVAEAAIWQTRLAITVALATDGGWRKGIDSVPSKLLQFWPGLDRQPHELHERRQVLLWPRRRQRLAQDLPLGVQRLAQRCHASERLLPVVVDRPLKGGVVLCHRLDS